MKKLHRVKLFNSEEPGFALVLVEAPDCAKWATEDMGSIGGSRWEADGSDFAYAMIKNMYGLVAMLQAEGYDVDDSDFEPIEMIENPVVS